MSEKKNVIIVSEEDRNYVQRADVEMSSRQNLIGFMLAHNLDTSTEQFKKYEEEYKNAFLTMETAKEYISNTYLKGINAISWNLDYESCELTYEC
jgi:hypothetical protein